MAISRFRVHYKNGEPIISVDEVKYHNPENNNQEGAIAPQEKLTDPNLQNVLVEINSSQKILTQLKNDDRAVWIEDVSGWDKVEVAPKHVKAETKKPVVKTETKKPVVKADDEKHVLDKPTDATL